MSKYQILCLETMELVVTRNEYFDGIFQTGEYCVLTFYLTQFPGERKSIIRPFKVKPRRVDIFKPFICLSKRKALKWIEEYCEKNNYDPTLFQLVKI